MPIDHVLRSVPGITATGAGETVDLKSVGASRSFALQVIGEGGTPTAWDVRLEVDLGESFPGNNTSIIQHQDSDGTGVIKWAVDKPALRMRYRVHALTLAPATGITVRILSVK